MYYYQIIIKITIVCGPSAKQSLISRGYLQNHKVPWVHQYHQVYSPKTNKNEDRIIF